MALLDGSFWAQQLHVFRVRRSYKQPSIDLGRYLRTNFLFKYSKEKRNTILHSFRKGLWNTTDTNIKIVDNRFDKHLNKVRNRYRVREDGCISRRVNRSDRSKD